MIMAATSFHKILVGSRSSPLARIQVEEVLAELRQHHPYLDFDPTFVDSTGDKDQQTSLRILDKTDFFTKEIDEMLLKKECRIAIHSAKDLPSPLPKGLLLVALTRGIDPSDSLVLMPGQTIHTLPTAAVIATSSVRREEAVRRLRSDLTFIDIRGTIGKRLEKLYEGEAQGVVLAEAAIIRLGLTSLNRITLPGDTVPFQGQLAVVARADDFEMRELFACIDSRPANLPEKQVLYVGLELPPFLKAAGATHCPLISIFPRGIKDEAIRQTFNEMSHYTHIIFTSKSSVAIFCELAESLGIPLAGLQKKSLLAVGRATASKMGSFGLNPSQIAKNETAEGIIDLLMANDLSDAYVFWPHSALSRPVIAQWLEKHNVRYRDTVLYDTIFQKPAQLPELKDYSEIIFTSPSTIDAFKQAYGIIPMDKRLTCIGPITEQHLKLAVSPGVNPYASS